MLEVLFTWVVSFLVCVGVGLLFRRCLRLNVERAADLFPTFWVGWSLILAFLQVWQIFFAVDLAALLLVALTGTIGCLLHASQLRWLATRVARQHALLVALCGVAAFVVSAHAVAPLRHYDAGLYHLQTVQWNNSYPLVPGLANLHGRLAFNKSVFLYQALLNVGPLEDRSHHLANSLLFVVFLAQGLCAWARLFSPRSPGQPQAADFFLALLLIPAIGVALRVGALSSTSTDLFIFLLQALIATELVKLVTTDLSSRQVRLSLLYVVLLTATGVAANLTFAPFALGAGTAVLVRYGKDLLACRRTTVLLLAAAAVVLAPWAVRGILISGYPVYPVRLGGLPVDWKVPDEQAIWESNALTGFARAPGPDYEKSIGNWDWLGPWLARRLRSTFPILLLALVLGAVAAFLGRRSKRLDPVWLVLILPAVALPVWFLAAPFGKYAAALFWIAVAGAATVLARQLGPSGRRWLLVAACALTAIFYFPELSQFVRRPIALARGRAPGGEDIPRAAIVPYTTSSGLILYVPEQGDQAWNAPLPSTPYPARDIRLRCPNDLRCGFARERWTSPY